VWLCLCVWGGGVVICECFDNCVDVLVICVLVFTVFVLFVLYFCIVSFMYIYYYFFCLYLCEDYCHSIAVSK
jgi:hypothetical protein